MSNVLVIGGTLFIGKLLVRKLLAAGHEVTILHRTPGHALGSEVRELIADRNDPGTLNRLLSTATFDVVFDNVYDWQRGTTGEQVALTARAFRHLRRYLYMSSIAAYGTGLERTESDPLAPADDPDLYVRNKASSERALFQLHANYGLPVTTLRPPFIYGPENPFYREAFFWDRLRLNRPILIPDDGQRLMQFCYVEDLVAACLRAMDEPAAVGEAFNIANPAPITQQALVEALATAAGVEPRLVFVPRAELLRLGGHPMQAPLYFGAYFDLPPITQQTGKMQRLLALHATDLAVGLRASYAAFRPQTQDYSFEDAVLAAQGMN